jgi:hypothetical protein
MPDNAVPGGWVNASGKFAVGSSKDGGKVLRKNNTNPNSLFAQSSCFVGAPDLSDYTIECDVLGGRKQRTADKGFDMPDVGIINSRYTLTLVGNLQRLRLLSWDAMPRVDQAVDFKFDANVWYRMKLAVEPRGDKVTIRGKVWPRSEKEPEAWVVEFVDPTPNREGAPGLYGFSTGIQEDEPGTEILYDNLVVTPNKKGAGSASR